MTKWVFLAALAAGSLSPALASAAGAYDGNWSLSVVTEKGSCDGYRWTVVVANGQVRQINDVPLQASGAISANGQARFQFVSSSDKVSVSGQMSAATGRGSWQSPSRDCAGRWEASRL